MKLPVYFDSSATTPCDREVVEAMVPFFSHNFGNPASRSHLYGWEAAEAVENSRHQVARLIGAKPFEIIFTSGATESCNLAIKGIIESRAGEHKHIITLSTEHRAVLETISSLENDCEVSVLKVNRDGLPDLDELELSIRPATVLIAVMYANNETGVILPVKEIARIAKKHSVLFFSDATQAVGKISVDVAADGMDIMAFTAHKMYGPKGVGALYVRSKKPAIAIKAQISGGNHERNLRSGTLNVPGIVGFGKAAFLSSNEYKKDASRLLKQRIKLEKALLGIPNVYLNGHVENRLPHITNISIENVESERLLLYLSSKLALSSGAACSSLTHEPSHVLVGMGVQPGLLHCSVRISQGRYTTPEEIDFAIDEIKKAIERLRSESSQNSNNHLQPSSSLALPG